MTNVLICGILGRMGKQLVESAAGTDVRVSCGVDIQAANYPVFRFTLRLMRFVSASIASSIFPTTRCCPRYWSMRFPSAFRRSSRPRGIPKQNAR